MIIYVLLALAIIILPMLKIDKKKYCIIIGTLMTLIVGFRNIDMGMNDTRMVYVSLFDQISDMSFLETYNFIIKSDIEVVFYMLTRLFILITTNIRLYLLLLTIPVNYLISRFIYKYSKIPFLSFLLYFSINYFAFSFTLLRHCIAMVILLLSYDALKENKKLKFFLLVILASLFHRTAVIFIIVFFFKNRKLNIKYIVSIPLFILLFTITLGTKTYRWIMNLSFLKLKRYSIYLNPKANTLTFFFINFLILVVSLIIYRKKIKDAIAKKEDCNDEDISLLLYIQMIGTCFASFMYFFSEMFRVSTFFTIFSIILLPNCISTVSNIKTKKTYILIISIILIVYFFMFTMHNNSIYPYRFGGFDR